MFMEANTLFILAPVIGYNRSVAVVNIFSPGKSPVPPAQYRPMIFQGTREQNEDGWFVVECPALPGCVSQGRDQEEALENIKEAILQTSA